MTLLGVQPTAASKTSGDITDIAFLQFPIAPKESELSFARLLFEPHAAEYCLESRLALFGPQISEYDGGAESTRLDFTRSCRSRG
jgi:hypothetical protein